MDRAISAGTEYFSVVKVGIIVGHIAKTVVCCESHDSRTVFRRIVIVERVKVMGSVVPGTDVAVVKGD